MRRAHLLVTGHVQGVYFRAAVNREAQVLSVRGWVRNLPDGRVEAVLEGPEGRVGALLDWIQSGGPSGARVDAVAVKDEQHTDGFAGFTIER